MNLNENDAVPEKISALLVKQSKKGENVNLTKLHGMVVEHCLIDFIDFYFPSLMEFFFLPTIVLVHVFIDLRPVYCGIGFHRHVI